MVLSNIFWNNFMLSRTKCLLNNKSLTNPLLTFICHFFEWRSSIPILGTWVSFWYLWFFLTDLVLNYSDQYLFVYVGIFSGAVYFLSDFLLEIVHLLVGILLNPLLPKKTRAHDSTFFLDLFQFADKCFRSNHRTWESLIYRKFTWKI